MFKRKQKEIDSLNARCVELAKMLREKNDELKMQKDNNAQLLRENGKIRNENADLRNEIDEIKEVIKQINLLTTCNQYNNEITIRNKIKELTSDNQSIC